MNNQSNKFKSVTNGVVVVVNPIFYPEVSNQIYSIYVWLYNVRIKNLRASPIQLLRRYWRIYDSNAIIEEARGDGVVGKQQIINSMQMFEYSSQVRLFTGSGIMEGRYTMLNTESMDKFEVRIPTFSLDVDPFYQRFKN